MFGYVTIDKPELKIREFELYRSFYCGLCRELREKYGIPGQVSLTYDMTFVIMLLTSLYELPVQKGTTRCVIHPVIRQNVRKSDATDYGADMNVLLTYYKCLDDWKDEKKVLRRGYAGLLSGRVREVEQRYPRQTQSIKNCLQQLSDAEKEQSTDIDLTAGIFGHLMEEIFVRQEDVWTGPLKRMGFFLGKYIYLMDACEDVEKDVKNGNYNIFASRYRDEDFEEKTAELLTMMLSEACREFERLPVLWYEEILRNILYSGVWNRYRLLMKKKAADTEKAR